MRRLIGRVNKNKVVTDCGTVYYFVPSVYPHLKDGDQVSFKPDQPGDHRNAALFLEFVAHGSLVDDAVATDNRTPLQKFIDEATKED